MGRYPVPSNSVSAGVLILPRDSYTVTLSAPKVFQNLDRDTQEIRNFGFRLSATVVSDGPYKGKSVPVTFYWHNDGSIQMTKRAAIAILGFNADQGGEAAFNDEFPELWVDTDTSEVCPAFSRFEGRTVIIDADVRINPNNGEQQNNFRWRKA